MSNFNALTSLAPEAAEFYKAHKMQLLGADMTSCQLIILTDILSRTVSKISRSYYQIFAVDRE